MWLFKSRIPKNATRKYLWAYFLGVQLTWGIETDNCQVDRVAQTIFDAYPPCQTVMNHLKKRPEIFIAHLGNLFFCHFTKWTIFNHLVKFRAKNTEIFGLRLSIRFKVIERSFDSNFLICQIKCNFRLNKNVSVDQVLFITFCGQLCNLRIW